MWQRRQAMVVKGGGSGGGIAQSGAKPPFGSGRTLQQGVTGSQKYSSSVRPTVRGAKLSFHHEWACSSTKRRQSTAAPLAAALVMNGEGTASHDRRMSVTPLCDDGS